MVGTGLALVMALAAMPQAPAVDPPEVHIVVLKAGYQAEAVADRHGVPVRRTYERAVHGFSAALTTAQAEAFARDPQVAYLQRNVVHHAQDTQSDPPSWGLDRIDQRTLPLDAEFASPSGAADVHAYVIDTGVRTTHHDFGGRAASGYDAIDGGAADDCNGHGTHVAGTIAGAAHGVAKQAKVVAVRVLDCGGSGTTETVLAGVDWVTANAVKPAVANMSLGGSADQVLDEGVKRSIASGVVYALSAGNGSGGQPRQACVQSPARVSEALTVSATDRDDNRAAWANYGTCVDLLAPGVRITSAWGSADDATETISGTSMSAPHVAGAAALVLQSSPQATVPQVMAAVLLAATPDVVLDPLEGTPNRLLYVGDEDPTQPSPSPSPSPGLPGLPGLPSLPGLPALPALPSLPALPLPQLPPLPPLPQLPPLPALPPLPSLPGLPAIPLPSPIPAPAP
jgi:subtilisin family serine protease